MDLFNHITGFALIAVLLMTVWLAEGTTLTFRVKTGDNVIFRIPDNCTSGYILRDDNGRMLAAVSMNYVGWTHIFNRTHLSYRNCSEETGAPICFTYSVTSDQDLGYYYLFNSNTSEPCFTRYLIKGPDDMEESTTLTKNTPTTTHYLTTISTYDDMEESTTMTTNTPTTANTTSARKARTFLSTNALTTISTYDDMEESTTMTTNTPTTANTTSARKARTFLSTNALTTISTYDDMEESTTMTTNTPTTANTTSARRARTFLSTNALTTISTYDDMEESTTMTTNTPFTANTTSARRARTFLSTNALTTISISGTTAVQTSIILDILQQLRSGNTTAIEALKVLANRTKTSTLVKNELHQIESVLEEIINKLTLEVSDLQPVTRYFMEVASNYINKTKAQLSREKLKMNNSGAESIINLVDRMVSRLLNVTSNESIKLNFTSQELYVEVVTAVECQENITFPNLKEVSKESNFAQTMCPEDVNTTSYSGVIYYNIGELIKLPTDRGNMSKPADVSNRKKVQPTIISFTISGFNGRVLINIKVDNQKYKDPVCVFLDIRDNMWSDKGCKLVSHDINAVRCECNHLTNFAVLMSVMDVSVNENTALNVLSIVSCCISIMCLLVTMVIHIVYKRKLTSTHSSKVLLLTVLCAVLIFTYILFLAGVNKTDNKVVCTAIAVILHISLLTVFSLMLSIGIDYMLTVVKPLYTKNLGNHMILASFVCPAVIVGISAAATGLNGYGNDKACWLSMENSAKLAFIVPVCLVVCVNIGIVIVMFKFMFNQSTMKKKTGEEKIRTSIRNIFILSPVFGFTWIIGIFAVNKETIAFQYVFVILNGLQGVLIMVFHCILNQKVRGIVRSRTYRRKRLLESSNQTSDPAISTKKSELQSTTAL